MTRRSEEAFVRIAVEAAERGLAERAAAEAYEAGARGLEERTPEGGAAAEGEAAERGTRLLLYVPRRRAGAVRRALAPLEGEGLRVAAPEAVVPEDWARSWRAGLGPVEISPRLVVRPSFAAAAPAAGCVEERGAGGSREPRERIELVIDPGQAFGTGGHASTRLALALLDAIPRRGLAGARVLDVGCGTGVLAIAACRLGAERAVAFDLDPLAAEATARNAARNGAGARVAAFAGPLGALAPGLDFDLLLANLLRSEMLPLLPALAARTRAGGRALFSGLLASEGPDVEARLAAAGLHVESRREATDAGGEAWVAFLTRRAARGASSRGGRPGRRRGQRGAPSRSREPGARPSPRSRPRAASARGRPGSPGARRIG